MGKTTKIKIEDLIGRRFGDLTIIGEAPSVFSAKGNKRRQIICICICNKEKTYNYTDLTCGHSKSCGCKRAELMSIRRKKIPLVKARYRLFQLYKRMAKKRNYSFELTYEQFEKITLKNCNYCNIKPEYILPNRNKTEFCTYNGVDRVDNNKGYTLDNVVPCCRICNFAKEQQSLEDFKKWIKRIYYHMNT